MTNLRDMILDWSSLEFSILLLLCFQILDLVGELLELLFSHRVSRKLNVQRLGNMVNDFRDKGFHVLHWICLENVLWLFWGCWSSLWLDDCRALRNSQRHQLCLSNTKRFISFQNLEYNQLLDEKGYLFANWLRLEWLNLFHLIHLSFLGRFNIRRLAS